MPYLLLSNTTPGSVTDSSGSKSPNLLVDIIEFEFLNVKEACLWTFVANGCFRPPTDFLVLRILWKPSCIQSQWWQNSLAKVLQSTRPISDLYFLNNLEAKRPQVSESRGMSGPRPSSHLKFFRFSSNYTLCSEIITDHKKNMLSHHLAQVWCEAMPSVEQP